MDEKIQKLAKQLSQALVTDKRNDGQEFVKLKDDSPDWMTEVIHSAHGESFPDDTIYEFISRAANAFADSDIDSDESDIISEIEPDIYTSDLTAWLNKRNDHVYYLTEALEEFGSFDNGFNLLAMAQKLHIDEIAYALFNALDNLEDPDESPDEDPDSDDSGDDKPGINGKRLVQMMIAEDIKNQIISYDEGMKRIRELESDND